MLQIAQLELMRQYQIYLSTECVSGRGDKHKDSQFSKPAILICVFETLRKEIVFFFSLIHYIPLKLRVSLLLFPLGTFE